MSQPGHRRPDPPLAPVLGWLDWLLCLELVVLAVVLGCFLNRDTDIWWHLRAGREMLAGGGIPRADRFLFSSPGAEWIDLHWIFQIGAAAVHRLGGSAGLTVAAAIAAGAAMALALGATARRGATLAVVWCWLPALFVMSARFLPRPEMLSLVFLAATLLVLQQAVRSPVVLWVLVPLQIAWVNVQGLFVLGLVVLACWVADREVRGQAPRRWRDRVGAPLAVVLASGLNPYGWKGALFPLTLFRRMSSEQGFYGRHIGELMSLPDVVMSTGFSSVYVRLATLLCLGAAASFAVRRGRVDQVWYRVLLLLLFTGLGLLAQRNLPQFALVVGAVLAWNVAEWAREREEPALAEAIAGRLLTSAVLVGLVAWVASGRFHAYAGEGRLVGLGEQPRWYAHEAARVAAREGMPRHVLAYHEGQAAVFEYHMRPDQRVFVDPRLEVTSRAALEAYYDLAVDLSAGKADALARLEQLPQPLALLVDHGSHHAVEATLLADGRWRPVWFDAVAGVYLPQSAGTVVDAPTVDFGARHFLATARGAREADDGARWAADALKRAESLHTIGRDLLARRPADEGLAHTLLLLAYADAAAVAQRTGLFPRLALVLAGSSVALHPSPPGDVPPVGWPVETIIGAARARAVLARALQRSPGDFDAWIGLFAIGERLGDPDAQLTAGARLTALQAGSAAQFEAQRQMGGRLRRLSAQRASEPPVALPIDASDVLASARDLVARRRFTRALTYVEQSLVDGLDGSLTSRDLADLRATLFLIAGDAAGARRIWTSAGQAPDPALARRLAASFLVEGNVAEARAAYRRALAAPAEASAAHYGLAMCHLEAGEADGVVRECRVALTDPNLPGALADTCTRMITMAEPYASSAAQRESTVRPLAVERR